MSEVDDIKHEIVALAIREEILRQYRDDDRGRCVAGVNFYEEYVGPGLIADAVFAALEKITGGDVIVIAARKEKS